MASRFVPRVEPRIAAYHSALSLRISSTYAESNVQCQYLRDETGTTDAAYFFSEISSATDESATPTYSCS